MVQGDFSQYTAQGVAKTPRLASVANEKLGCNITADLWRDVHSLAADMHLRLIFGLNGLLRVGAEQKVRLRLLLLQTNLRCHLLDWDDVGCLESTQRPGFHGTQPIDEQHPLGIRARQ